MKRAVGLVSLAPALAIACAANTHPNGIITGATGATSGSGDTSGAGAGSLTVTVGAGSGGGSQGNCDATVDICDEELKNPQPCDSGLALADGDPGHAAKAIDLCRMAGANGWGLVSAKYVRANGQPASAGLNTGLVGKFGQNIKPQFGGAMLALSSGHARDMAMPGACGGESCQTTGMGTAPNGFPQDVPGCQGSTQINDDIGLEVALRAPKNAKGYTFKFAFMSFEFSTWVCTPFNDQFMALVSPAPMGSINGNVSFDKKKNPVSVNIALFDHCDPSTLQNFGQMCGLMGGNCPQPPNPFCPDGGGFLDKTGWGKADGWSDSGNGGGSTGWLVTTAPIHGGDPVTIRFAIWDAGDQNLDSLVLVDDFRWSADPVGIGTDPVPNPK